MALLAGLMLSSQVSGLLAIIGWFLVFALCLLGLEIVWFFATRSG